MKQETSAMVQRRFCGVLLDFEVLAVFKDFKPNLVMCYALDVSNG